MSKSDQKLIFDWLIYPCHRQILSTHWTLYLKQVGDESWTLLHNFSQHHKMVLLEVRGKNLGNCSAEAGFDLPGLQTLNQRALILNSKLLNNLGGHVAIVVPLYFIRAVLSRGPPGKEADTIFDIRAVLIMPRVTVCGLCLESSSPGLT